MVAFIDVVPVGDVLNTLIQSTAEYLAHSTSLHAERLLCPHNAGSDVYLSIS